MATPRTATTYIRRDGSSTVVPDFTGDEMRDLIDQAGLSELNKHSPDLARLDPLTLIAGMQRLEGLMGIRNRPAPAAGERDEGLLPDEPEEEPSIGGPGL